MEIYVFVAKKNWRPRWKISLKKWGKVHHVLNVISTFNFAGCGLVRVIWKLGHLRILFKSNYTGYCGLAEFCQNFSALSDRDSLTDIKSFLTVFTGWSTAGKAGLWKKSWNLWAIVCVAASGFPVKLNSAFVPQKLRKPCESSSSFYTFLKQVELFVILNKSPPQAFSCCFQWHIQALS